VVKDAVQLARLEGLEGHARAAERRLTSASGGGDDASSPNKKART
jgi:hypothetical protein